MRTFDLTTDYETYKDCFFALNNYQMNESLAIDIWNYEDGPIARLTVCLGNVSNENSAYIDTNNCSWAENFIKEMQLGKPTGKTCRSGFCVYPEYEFNIDKLRDYMADEFEDEDYMSKEEE